MLSRLAIRRSVTTLMVTLMVFLVGLVAYTNLDMDLMPEVDVPIVVVSTTYIGAGPEEIESLVTEPLEKSLSTVSNVEKVMSVSSANVSMVMVQFVDGTDIDVASMDLRDVLGRVKSELPNNANEPNIIKMDMNAMPIAIGVTAENLDLRSLNELVEDNVATRLERIEGVASVDISGGVEREIRIIIDPDKMAGYGLTPQTLNQILTAENMNLPSGALLQGTTDVQIRTLGEFTSIEEIRELPITTQSGAVIHLSDVAAIEEVEVDKTSSSIIDGNYGVLLSVNKQSTANLVEVSEKLNHAMEDINRSYPELKMVMLTDTAEYIQMSLSNVTETALLSAAIAFFVLLVFLKNPITSLIIAMSIPTSIFATFGLMYVSGITLNTISMGGLAIGIGMLVDNSVVVLDSIHQYYERGYDPKEAAEAGAKEVTMAVMASTLTSVAVFLPISFVSGAIGQIMKSLSFTICFALISSLVVSITFVPMACALFLRRKSEKKKKGFHISYLFDLFFDGLEKLYGKLMRISLRHPVITVALVLATFVASLYTIPLTGMDFMDETDEGVANITIELPNGSDIDQTEEIVWEVLNRLESIPEKEMVYASVGGGGFGSNAAQASVTVNLLGKTERERSSAEIAEDIQDMMQDIPGAEITAAASGAAMGSFGGADVTFQVYGYDAATLLGVEQDLVAQISQLPGFKEVEGSTGMTVPEAKVVIDRNKASLYGITTASIASALNTAISGSTATEYKVDGTEIDVVIRYDTQEVNYLTDLHNLTVTSAYGGEVPISSVAHVEMGESAVSISRENQKNYITIEASIEGMSSSDAQKNLTTFLDGYAFPEGCTYSFGGTLEMMNDSFQSLSIALIAAVLLVYMIMASQFESLRYPFIIMFSMPLAFTGAIFGLFLTGNTITMTSMMGFIMLAGMVVNNGIVLIDYTNQLMERGMQCYDALTTAGPRRLRPILMTTLTTILGMLPLIFSNKEGSETMHSMAISVVFGLSLSSIVTLIFIPVLYAGMNKSKEKRKAKRMARRAKRQEQ